jgi:phosphoglycerate dehydrogenase-like enzyme
MKVLVFERISDAQLARVRAAAEQASVVHAPAGEGALPALADAEVVFGGIRGEAFSTARRLRWNHVLNTFVDGYLFPELVASDVVLTSTKDCVGTHLAEQAFGLLLAITRSIAAAVRVPRWDARLTLRANAAELAGQTMGVIGLSGSAVGPEVARRAAAFGMHVVAVDPEPEVAAATHKAIVERVAPLERVHDLLREADVVVVCAPLIPATRGLLDLAALRQMRRHAVLINVSRSAIVDEGALVAVLSDGVIAGAGLDALPHEPLPPDHPLWHLANVVITPHVGGSSPHRVDRSVDLFCRNLVRYQEGTPLESVIDKAKGVLTRASPPRPTHRARPAQPAPVHTPCQRCAGSWAYPARGP